MSTREQRGMQIAAVCRIVKHGDTYSVPSQTDSKIKYTVNPIAQTCSCPDFEERGCKCKHIYAVSYVIQRETNDDGSITQTETVTVTKRTTYHQNWPAYNVAQTTEKRRIQVLLQDLCRNLPDEDRTHKRGPKPHLTRDCVFSIVFKVYCGFSSRRFNVDLDEAFQRGFLTRRVTGMKVPQFMEDESLTPILTDLVSLSAAPLASVETCFAVDSTGFSSSRIDRWYDEKYGTERSKAVWVKAHCCIGTRTNCVASVRVLEKDSADSPQFGGLVEKTSETFTVDEVSADKAYTSNGNFEVVNTLGGTAYLPFKYGTTGGVGGLFEKMFHFFQFQKEEYMNHYHKRSNAESTFSAVKRKFGDSILSKTDVAMKNEVLCKLVAHNLCCLVQEQEELGIAPIFWKD